MHNPAHPGEILRELIVEPMGMSVTKAARHLNVSRKILSKVLNARGAVTPEMSVRLELAFRKLSADHWLRLQAAYDLWNARRNSETLAVEPCVLSCGSREVGAP